jgi:hypothetical protein
MDEIGRGAVSYLAGCAKRVAIAGRTGILRDKYANFWNSPCATECLSIGRDLRLFELPLKLPSGPRNTAFGSSKKGRDKGCHSISFPSHFAISAKTKLGSPDLECLQYLRHYEYEF